MHGGLKFVGTTFHKQITFRETKKGAERNTKHLELGNIPVEIFLWFSFVLSLSTHLQRSWPLFKAPIPDGNKHALSRKCQGGRAVWQAVIRLSRCVTAFKVPKREKKNNKHLRQCNKGHWWRENQNGQFGHAVLCDWVREIRRSLCADNLNSAFLKEVNAFSYKEGMSSAVGCRRRHITSQFTCIQNKRSK